MILPAAGYLSNGSRTEAEMKTAFENLRDAVARSPGGAVPSSLTISSGAITPIATGGGGWVIVDTEGAVASDELDQIIQTNTPDGSMLFLRSANNARTVVVKDAGGGSGQILTSDGQDFALDATDKWIALQRRGTDWVETTRSLGVQDFKRAVEYALAPCENLLVSTVTSASLTITADYAILRNAAGEQKQFSSISETPDITVSGAGGLDTGSESSSTWYHIYLIGQVDGTIDAVYSTNASVPALPSGYDFYGYVGAVFNDGSSDFLAMKQAGNVAGTFQQAVLSNGTATTATSVDISDAAPPTAKVVEGFVTARSNNTTTGVKTGVVSSTTAGGMNGSPAVLVGAHVTSPTSGIAVAYGHFRLPQIEAGNIYYRAATSGDQVDVHITGWEF